MHVLRNSSRLARVVLAVVMLMVGIGIGTGAMAVAQSTGTVYYACVDGNSGAIKMVNAAATCRKNETKIDWNQVGQQGPQGLPGDKGDTGDVGPAGSPTRTFTAGGTYEYTVPEGVDQLVVELRGGGGGGGGAMYVAGAGGGQGGYVKAFLTVTSGETYQITVGAGGSGTHNTNTSYGQPGLASAVTLNGVTLVSATGGEGGAFYQYQPPGDGGSWTIGSGAAGIEAANGASGTDWDNGGLGGGPAGFMGSGGANGTVAHSDGVSGYVIIEPVAD